MRIGSLMHTTDVNLVAGGTTTLIATANNTIVALLAKLWGSWSEVHCQQQQTVQVPLQVPQEGEQQDPLRICGYNKIFGGFVSTEHRDILFLLKLNSRCSPRAQATSTPRTGPGVPPTSTTRESR